MEKLLLLAAALCFCGMVFADELRPIAAEEMAGVVPSTAVDEVAELDNNETGGFWPATTTGSRVVPSSETYATIDRDDQELGVFMRSAESTAWANGVAPIARSVPNW